ncbi:FAD:protein FMN transferase [Paenibacillus antibioticophila]|uniref:FAD:protein FMN transferase n=1 Tax=Paenibacillus antibioticophila TaxID=1274374 RepID=A0A919XWU7_9BACL|nr:FAD:protein FMN transferase [Paenibacillus antibioticophila]GIO37938.1 FAD:protein FMN transferase [Paenibacillus antibioticophila]
MFKNKAVVLLLSAVLLTGLLSGCGSTSSKNTKEGSAVNANGQAKTVTPVSETFFIFDTVVTIKIYDNHATTKNFEELEDLMKDIDYKINRSNEDSEIYAVNANAGIAPVKVSQETFDLVKIAVDYAKQTNGLLDPSIGPLVSLWNIGHEDAHVPPAEDIAAAQKLIDYRKVELNEDTLEIYLQDKGMDLDLGSYGKGYAADLIYDKLKEQGFDSAIIDLGGNVFAMGSKPGNLEWTVGIQDPDQKRGNDIGTVKVIDKTVVTAGIYERYFVENGKFYMHILDPRTGYPAENNISSVTIIADSSTAADTMDTSLLIMGIEDGLKFAEENNTEALFITKDKQLYATPGFKELLNKSNDEYSFAN